MDKMNVKEFCEKYDKMNDKEKQDYLASIIYRNYCPVIEKQYILKTLNEKCIVTTENGVSYIDMFLSKINWVMAILVLYTTLDVVHDNADGSTSFDDYDELAQRDILVGIYGLVGEREIKELLSINSTIIENYNRENNSVDGCIRKYIERIGILAKGVVESINPEVIKMLANSGQGDNIVG